MKDRSIKREEAEQRQIKHDKLTISQKIKKLDNEFGIGVGAIAEREGLNKLLKKIENKKD